MATKIIINKENPNGIEVELTAEEETQRQADITNAEIQRQAEETARQAKADLKASAKAKLIAGEALTEDEANTIVL
jgi:regulator of protease activity HflC (stomatin/prohibitin superfamily)